VLFGVVGLAAVHLSVGAAPEQESVSPEQEPVSPVDACAQPTWVAAWSAPPQASSAHQAPILPAGVEGRGPSVYENQTLRMVLTPAAAGSRLRIRLSNRFGSAPVTFGSVHVGHHAGGGAIVDGTDRTVTFAGSSSITVPSGGAVASDVIDLPVEPFTDLTVSIHVADATALDVHLFAQQTQFTTSRGAGDHTGDVGGGAFTERLASWLAVSALDVLAPRPIGVVVALGDSITDGVGSTPDADQRWTDQLARRLLAEPGPSSLTVVNAGIGGNQITQGASDVPPAGMGPGAATRFDTDVVEMTGVTDVVVFIGINDLYAPNSPDPAAAIIDGYRAIIDRARLAGLGVIGTTITPGGLAVEQERQRQAVNEWVRTEGSFDSVVDLDAVVRDPNRPAAVAPQFAADPVHLNDAGYAAVAGAFDLGSFEGARCARNAGA
jgi:lysophospholipase L1-like esterase